MLREGQGSRTFVDLFCCAGHIQPAMQMTSEGGLRGICPAKIQANSVVPNFSIRLVNVVVDIE